MHMPRPIKKELSISYVLPEKLKHMNGSVNQLKVRGSLEHKWKNKVFL